MLSIKSIKLPSIHVDFLLLCSCQVSSHSEYFIIIYVSLMSHVGGKTLISDHRDPWRSTVSQKVGPSKGAEFLGLKWAFRRILTATFKFFDQFCKVIEINGTAADTGVIVRPSKIFKWNQYASAEVWVFLLLPF